ncbi:MAG: MlaD family protein [Bacteroidaceae bacterium]|nr:MlaD family protein [Bacteroidaceae bacterium]
MKAFTKEVKIGITVIVALAMLICGINFLKGINLFQKSNLYYVAFNDISGLGISNPVYANGYRIGIVRTIEYDYNKPGNVYVGIEVEDNIHITQGSYAELEAQMLGGVTMNIMLGQSPISLSPGDTIKGGPKISALDKMGQTIPQLQNMMPKIDSILTSINSLLSNPALQQTLTNAALLSEQLKTTTNGINTLLNGKVASIAANLEPTTKNLQHLSYKLDSIDYNSAINNINNTLTQLQKTTTTLDHAVNTTMDKINQPNSTLGLLLNDRTLYDNINRNLISSDSLLNDLRLHPKRYVHFSIFGRKQ